MGGAVLARVIFAVSIVGTFLGDFAAALAARGRLPVVPAVTASTVLFAVGGVEAFYIYGGMEVFTVAWLWPALMQLGHTVGAVLVFGERPSVRELVGSAVVLVGVFIAATSS